MDTEPMKEEMCETKKASSLTQLEEDIERLTNKVKELVRHAELTESKIRHCDSDMLTKDCEETDIPAPANRFERLSNDVAYIKIKLNEVSGYLNKIFGAIE